MTQPFDPMDKLLREALASESQPPADLTDRIMARVAETPQQTAPVRKKNIKWLATAAACLVLVGAALPMALRRQANETADRAMPENYSATDADSADENTDTLLKPACNDGDMVDSSANEFAAKQDIAADRQSEPSLDTALAAAEEALSAQGYTLEVAARDGDAVQVTATDGSGHTAPADVLDGAMSAAGFNCHDGWYTLREVTP